MISIFCYKVMSFCDLSKLLPMARKFSRNNPQHLEANFVPFSHKNFQHLLCTQNCNENKVTPMCFLHHILRQNNMIVSLAYPNMMHLSLSIRFVYMKRAMCFIGYFGPPMRPKMKFPFHQIILISL